MATVLFLEQKIFALNTGTIKYSEISTACAVKHHTVGKGVVREELSLHQPIPVLPESSCGAPSFSSPSGELCAYPPPLHPAEAVGHLCLSSVTCLRCGYTCSSESSLLITATRCHVLCACVVVSTHCAHTHGLFSSTNKAPVSKSPCVFGHL